MKLIKNKNELKQSSVKSRENKEVVSFIEGKGIAFIAMKSRIKQESLRSGRLSQDRVNKKNNA